MAIPVATYADLCKVGTGDDGWTLDADYIQTADIQCPAGSSFVPIGDVDERFEGSYDGKGYEIRGLAIEPNTDSMCGLFATVASPSMLTNIKLVDVSITSGVLAGGVVAMSFGSDVSGCSVTGVIHAHDSVGGIVGYVVPESTTTISNCNATVDVEGETCGGIAGEIVSGSINNCSVVGTITASGSSRSCAGGVCGATRTSNSSIANCHADVVVSGDGAIGGLIGESRAELSDCTVTGSVTATGDSGDAGGLCGNHYTSPIVGCRVTNIMVTSNDVAGGIAAYAYDACSIEDCHATGTVTGTRETGGLIGFLSFDCCVSDCTADVDVVGSYYLGGLIGQACRDTTITNCHAKGGVRGTGDSVGGLIGYSNAMVINCTASGSVSTGNSEWNESVCGGLIGGAYSDGGIFGCSATGDVSATGEFVGGLVGRCWGLILLSDSFSTGNVSGHSHVGGFAGLGSVNITPITNCYSTGNVESEVALFVGGFIGHAGFSPHPVMVAENCYSTGKVTAHAPTPEPPPEGPHVVGGFIGFAGQDPEIIATECFWDVYTSGQSESVGGAVGKTTAEMQTLDTFTQWDIATADDHTDELWFIVPNKDYPRFAREGIPPPVSHLTVSIKDATEFFNTGRESGVSGVSVSCSRATSITETDGVFTLEVPGKLKRGDAVTVRISAPGYADVVTRLLQGDGDSISVFMWDVLCYTG